MDKDRAKSVLRFYRHSVETSEEELAALELLGQDRELAEWFADEQRFDDEVRAQLAEVRPPESLLVELKGLKANRKSNVVAKGEGFNRRQVFSLVAMIVAMVTVLGLMRHTRLKREQQFVKFRSDMVGMVQNLANSDLTMGDRQVIVATLRQGGAPVPMELTSRFDKGGEIGCCVRTWSDYKVSLVCLKIGDKGQVAHLFSITKEALGHPGKDQLDRVVKEQNLPTKAWREEGHYFLLVGGSQDTKLPNV